MMRNLYRKLTTEEYNILPVLDETKITNMEDLDWYDGAMSGNFKYSDKYYWFDLNDVIKNPNNHYDNYCYIAFKLTKEQYDESLSLLKKQETDWNKEGHVEYKGPDFGQMKPDARFMDGQNQNFYGVQLQ